MKERIGLFFLDWLGLTPRAIFIYLLFTVLQFDCKTKGCVLAALNTLKTAKVLPPSVFFLPFLGFFLLLNWLNFPVFVMMR